jgi:hypothetical protein
MTSVRATTAAARMPADLASRDTGQTLAGLIDVLDRADGATALVRPRPHRAAASRAAIHRAAAGRSVPLRSVRPAPPARPAPAPFPAAAEPAAVEWPVPVAPGGSLSAMVRRVALWGAGPQGEYLAWRSAPAAAVPPDSHPIPRDRSPVVRPPLRARLVRRVALWGAGPRGEHLAWSAGVPRPAAPGARARADVDRPVVLRELPSTPTIAPVASSPATALPAGPASSPAEPVVPPARSGTRPPVHPVVPRRPAGSRDPMLSARTPQPTGWPPRPPRPTSSFPAAGSAAARARGDPPDCQARGSPRPSPRPAPRAPG